MNFTITITPHLLEQFIASVITIAILALLAWAVRKFIGD